MKNNKLSHSAVTLFQSCPKSWKYHYQDRLRSKTTSSALLFGTAIDKAVTQMMENKRLEKDEVKPEDVFIKYWTIQKINEVEVNIPTCLDVTYGFSDYDPDLLKLEDEVVIRHNLGIKDYKEVYKKASKAREYLGYSKISDRNKLVINTICWFVLYRKGLVMLESVRSYVLPMVTEVLSTQAEVELKNDQGDSVVGFADLVCKLRGYDVPVIIDFKTSSRPYEKDSVVTSPQLSLYLHALSDKYEYTRKAGYIVMQKLLNKNKTKVCATCGVEGTGSKFRTCPEESAIGIRCEGEWVITVRPSCYIQVIVDDIPERTEDIVLQGIDDINQSIKARKFHRNFGSCVKPYGKCVFYNKCFKNSEEDLVVKTE